MGILAREVKGFTFQAKNEISSIMVDWTISCPGNTAHVTAFIPGAGTLVIKSPYDRDERVSRGLAALKNRSSGRTSLLPA